MGIGRWHELLLREFDESGMTLVELSRKTGLEVPGLSLVFRNPPERGITIKRAELVAAALGLELVRKRKPKRKAKAKRRKRGGA